MLRLCAMASESGNDDLNRDNAKNCETVSRISSKPDPLSLKTENQRSEPNEASPRHSDCSPRVRSRRTTVSEAISLSPMMTAWVASIDVAYLSWLLSPLGGPSTAAIPARRRSDASLSPDALAASPMCATRTVNCRSGRVRVPRFWPQSPPARFPWRNRFREWADRPAPR